MPTIRGKLQTHRLGWVRDGLDQRDFYYSAPAIALPDKVDLSVYASPVEDQSTLGSCTAQALVGALELLDNKDKTYTDLSKLFLYYNERVIEGTVKYDSGAMIRDGIKSLASTGCCHEDLWPYRISKFTTRPTPNCYVNAAKHRITSYRRLVAKNNCYQVLAQGYPFVFGFSVYGSFDRVGSTGIATLPDSREPVLGGHAVLATGFDRIKRMFLIKNSWSSAWALKGYFWMPEEYVFNSELSADHWVVMK